MAKPAHEPYSTELAVTAVLPRLKQRKIGSETDPAKLARHLDLSHQRIHQLVDEHVIARLPHGRFDQNDCRVRRGLERIGATVDAVDYITYANLPNLNAALRGGLLDVIEVRLRCVGAGPTPDFADSSAFLAGFQPMIDVALKRRLQ